MNNISYNNLTNIDLPEIKTIKKVIKGAIKYLKLDNLEFNIIIVDNNYIQNLNRDYRDIDKPTDVLSFALEDVNDLEYESIRLLGDIYISIDKAFEQSEQLKHSLERELCFLSIHGFLHLLGYDHMIKEDEKIMFSLQENILDEYFK